MEPRQFSQRLAAFAAGVVITAVIVGSQLGLAQHYDTKAAAALGAQRASAPLAETRQPLSPQKPG